MSNLVHQKKIHSLKGPT